MPAGPRIVAESPAMRNLLDIAQRIARNDVSVLLLGESGTGKEIVAQAIHAHSRRADRPFVRYNCAALPATLAEAELFGHAKGAFTGAHRDRRGIFAEADGGTLLLDEVSELPLEVQAKLLRVLQNGEVQTLGGRRTSEPRPRTDMRLICATNGDVEAAVVAGTFRADLLFRLSVVVLRLPPLRDRLPDIPGLAREFARVYGEKFEIGPVHVTQALIDRLCQQRWPGNVRELENAIARMVALGMQPVLDLPDWEQAQSTSLRNDAPVKRPRPGSGEVLAHPLAADPSLANLTLREQIERVEREILTETLARFGGNQSKAARSLNISRVTLLAKIRKYQISVTPFADDGSGPDPTEVRWDESAATPQRRK